MRRAANVDAAHPEIVSNLRKSGVCTLSLAAIGKGCPDVLWGYQGYCGLLEIKTPKHGTKPETKTAQETFRENWAGPVAVVTTYTEAIDAILAVVKGDKRVETING